MHAQCLTHGTGQYHTDQLCAPPDKAVYRGGTGRCWMSHAGGRCALYTLVVVHAV